MKTIAGLLLAGCLSATAFAQVFAVGAHVEGSPLVRNDWYPCVVSQGPPNYLIQCTNIDGTVHDWRVAPDRIRADTGQSAALFKKMLAEAFKLGDKVDAAPTGVALGWHRCTVLGWSANGSEVGIYHLRCQYPNATLDVDVGAHDAIRAATGDTAVTAKAPTAQGGNGGGTVAQGAYECWSSNRPNLTLNFTVRGANQYTGYNGSSGSFSFDPATQRITFMGGSLDGVMPEGFYSMYYVPQGRPTVSFRSSRGSEAAFCQKK